MRTIIRRATPEDAQALAALVAELVDYFLADPAQRDAAAPFLATVTPEAFRERLDDPEFVYHVLDVVADDGSVTLAGVVAVRGGSHLYHLFVREAFHRRGHAARLWRTAREAAYAAGNPGRFTVNSSLYARPVYERMGFRATGEVVRQDGIAFVPMQLDEMTS